MDYADEHCWARAGRQPNKFIWMYVGIEFDGIISHRIDCCYRCYPIDFHILYCYSICCRGNRFGAVYKRLYYSKCTEYMWICGFDCLRTFRTHTFVEIVISKSYNIKSCAEEWPHRLLSTELHPAARRSETKMASISLASNHNQNNIICRLLLIYISERFIQFYLLSNKSTRIAVVQMSMYVCPKEMSFPPINSQKLPLQHQQQQITIKPQFACEFNFREQFGSNLTFGRTLCLCVCVCKYFLPCLPHTNGNLTFFQWKIVFTFKFPTSLLNRLLVYSPFDKRKVVCH